MRALHPFPARMAPEILDTVLDDFDSDAVILDPMCGSGTVVKKAAERGIQAIGVDSDPLAVLMTRVAVRPLVFERLEEAAEQTELLARRTRRMTMRTSIRQCPETHLFAQYWFAAQQRIELSALVTAVDRISSSYPSSVVDALRLAISRMIITKESGASLAADISHSRPHKVRDSNSYDCFLGFRSNVNAILKSLKERTVVKTPRVHLGDARKRSYLAGKRADAIITSPPYLNAIDYLRGHKFSLIWFGYTLPQLRKLRASNIGAERSKELDESELKIWLDLITEFPDVRRLPNRFQNMLRRYLSDLVSLQRAFKNQIAGGGKVVTVIGDSNIRGTIVPNASIFAMVALRNGFALRKETIREIPPNKRYLPLNCSTGMLGRRMRHETIQVFEACPSR